MTKIYCDRCMAMTEHKHHPATASDPVNRWECLSCGFIIEAPLNPWARTKLRKEEERRRT